MNERNHQLDGMRGIAALFVAIGHCATKVGGLDAYSLSIRDIHTASLTDTGFRLIHVFINADAAVPIFFVLSGYVLTLSLRNSACDMRGFFRYAVRRAFRLLPVSIVSTIAIGVVVSANWEAISSNALLLSYSLNGVIWSLQVEVVGSVLIFGLVIFKRFRFAIFIALAVTLYLVKAHPHYLLILLPCFVLGALIDNLPRSFFPGWLAAIALTCLLFGDYVIGRGVAARYSQAITCFLVVGYVASNSLRILELRVVRFLGDVSYPFYLIHTLAMIFTLKAATMFGIVYSGSKSFGAWALLAFISVLMTCAMAWLTRISIELPGMRLGTRLSRHLVSSPTHSPVSAAHSYAARQDSEPQSPPASASRSA